jgi:hypothetical protein
MVTKEDISLAIEYIFENCDEKNMRYPKGDKYGRHYAERFGCVKGHLDMFKKHPKEFVNMAKRKMAKVI